MTGPICPPNVCAVYTEESHRGQGIDGNLLNMAVEDLRSKGISTAYLVTGHSGFYERYGWEFLCMVHGDGLTEPHINFAPWEQNENRVLLPAPNNKKEAFASLFIFKTSGRIRIGGTGPPPLSGSGTLPLSPSPGESLEYLTAPPGKHYPKQ